MNVLIVGSGAREHALAWKLKQSPRVDDIFIAPGNAGTAQIGRNLDIAATNIPELIVAAKEHWLGLVVVGPEAPLVAGIADAFRKEGILVFGPRQQAAALEGSKAFAKDLMQRYGIPCAQSRTFPSYYQACDYVKTLPAPIVVKADGLAAGKGAIVCATTQEALDALKLIMWERAFGDAGKQVVIEEYLTGMEVTFMAFTDGDWVIPMPPACDYKRAHDGDEGPNTGGMGGYSPPSFVPPELVGQVTETIIRPTLQVMAKEGHLFQGVIYAGVMLTDQGPKVLEFNARFGDPEAQVVLPLLKSDLLDIMMGCASSSLDRVKVEWSSGASVGVVIASGGYPGDYQTGYTVTGWDRLDEDITVFHGGTRLAGRRVTTTGGRVFTVVAHGRNLREARDKAYMNVPCLHFQGRHYRTDIAAREVGPLSHLMHPRGGR